MLNSSRPNLSLVNDLLCNDTLIVSTEHSQRTLIVDAVLKVCEFHQKSVGTIQNAEPRLNAHIFSLVCLRYHLLPQ